MLKVRMSHGLALSLILCCILMAVSNVHAACSGSSPAWIAASAERAEVNDCITKASSGDTINIPAGAAVWASPVSIAKTLTIAGAGNKNTVITDNTSSGTAGVFDVNLGDEATFTLKDIGFIYGTTAKPLQSIKIAGTQADTPKFRITGCAFTAPPVFALGIYQVYGLIDNNTFTNWTGNVIFVDGGPTISGDGLAATQRSVDYGSGNSIFIEDNIFSDDYGSNAFLELWDAPRVTVRYNTIKNGWISSHGYGDVYGPSFRGPVMLEIYNNTADCDGKGLCFNFIKWRGGGGVLQ